MSRLPNDFMTVREACKAMPTLLRNEGALRTLVARRAVRCWKVGGRVLLSRRELVEDLEACRVEREVAARRGTLVLGAGKVRFNNRNLQRLMDEYAGAR